MNFKTYILLWACLIPEIAVATYQLDCQPKSEIASFSFKGIFGTELSKPHYGHVSNFSVSSKFKNSTDCPVPKIKQFDLQWTDSVKFLMHDFEYSDGCELHIVLPSVAAEGYVWLEKTKHTLLAKSQEEFESYRAETLISQCSITKIEESPNKSLNFDIAKKGLSN
jgi:hypothetical protein